MVDAIAKPEAEGAPWVRVIIVNYNAGPLIQACVDALAAQTFTDFEAIVVDNASTDGSVAALELPDSRFRLIRNEVNVGFAAANNIGARGARTPWIATLNPDTVAEPNWLEEMRKGAERHPEARMLGATLVDAADPTRVDGFGDTLSVAGIPWRAGWGRPVTALPRHDTEVFSPCAAAALYDRGAFERAGGFDASFFCYVEDLDLGFRLRLAGERCMQLRRAIVRHRGSAITGEHSAFTLYHSFRNRLWLLFKNMPLPLLILAVPLNLVCSLALIVKHAFEGGATGSAIKGLLAGFACAGPLRSRRAVQKGRTISTAALARCLMWNPFQRAIRGNGRARSAPRALSAQIGNAEKVPRYLGLLVRNPRLFAARVRAWMQQSARNDNYDEWVERYDRIGPEDIEVLRSAAAVLGRGPLISLIMPVYNPPEELLRRAIQSVANQAYSNWELCIADDCSTEPYVWPLLQQFAQGDARIKISRRPENGGIAAATNSALELTSGEYVALIDQDDEIPPHALLLVVREIAADPAIDLIYSDEDKIDENGRRFDPYFKPDWNPALILSQNYFSHLGVYRRSLIERAGGFRDAFNGSQDYDLVLRCAELTTPDRIHHIPHVLYHWRAAAGSTARSATAKPYAITAGQQAVQSALDRRGIAGTVSVTQGQYYRIDYRIRVPLPQVSILIPSACRSKLVERCLARLLERTSYPCFEVLLLVSESARQDSSASAFFNRLANDRRVRILAYAERPFNFPWIMNWGVRHARGSVLCFLNDDTEVIDPDWLEQLVARLALPRVGAVGPMLYYPNDTIQHAGTILGLSGVADHAHRFAVRGAAGYFGRAAIEQDFSCITAACAVVSRNAFEDIGGFDEQLAVAFNDVDFCIRLTQAGWRIVWTPNVALYHHESATLGPQDSPERAERFRDEEKSMLCKWGSVLKSDKCYNSNLSLAPGRGFELAFPPRVDWRASILQVPMRNEKACN